MLIPTTRRVKTTSLSSAASGTGSTAWTSPSGSRWRLWNSGWSSRAPFAKTNAPTWCSWWPVAASSSRSARWVSTCSQRGEDVLTLHGESLVYWLRELVFRSAWLDLRLMEGQLEVAFDEETGEFAYFPAGHRTRRIGPPPHPSWREVAYTR